MVFVSTDGKIVRKMRRSRKAGIIVRKLFEKFVCTAEIKTGYVGFPMRRVIDVFMGIFKELSRILLSVSVPTSGSDLLVPNEGQQSSPAGGAATVLSWFIRQSERRPRKETDFIGGGKARRRPSQGPCSG